MNIQAGTPRVTERSILFSLPPAGTCRLTVRIRGGRTTTRSLRSRLPRRELSGGSPIIVQPECPVVIVRRVILIIPSARFLLTADTSYSAATGDSHFTIRPATTRTPERAVLQTVIASIRSSWSCRKAMNCRGGPSEAAPGFHIVFLRRGGHGGPPLQLTRCVVNANCINPLPTWALPDRRRSPRPCPCFSSNERARSDHTYSRKYLSSGKQDQPSRHRERRMCSRALRTFSGFRRDNRQ